MIEAMRTALHMAQASFASSDFGSGDAMATVNDASGIIEHDVVPVRSMRLSSHPPTLERYSSNIEVEYAATAVK